MVSRPARPIRKLHLDDLVLLVAKCLCGFTHFVISGGPYHTKPPWEHEGMSADMFQRMVDDNSIDLDEVRRCGSTL